MYARDAMQLQGFFLTDEEWDKLPRTCTERVLQSLAGNAFCLASALPIQMAAVIVLATLIEAGLASRGSKRQRSSY